MEKLLVIQQQIFASLLHNITFDKNLVKENQCLSAQASLTIYRNSRITSLLNSLRQTYEICVRIVGDDFFNVMAIHYIKQTPSYSANISEYGKTFSEFIAAFPPAQKLFYLADVAYLEWAWLEALHAAPTPGFDPQSLTCLSATDHLNIVFKLPNSARIITSNYPLHDIWTFNQQGYLEDPTINLDKGGIKLLVWRQDMDMRMDILEENDWFLLDAIQQHLSMSELCDIFLHQKQAESLPDMLANFVSRGWIGGYFLR